MLESGCQFLAMSLTEINLLNSSAQWTVEERWTPLESTLGK